MRQRMETPAVRCVAPLHPQPYAVERSRTSNSDVPTPNGLARRGASHVRAQIAAAGCARNVSSHACLLQRRDDNAEPWVA